MNKLKIIENFIDPAFFYSKPYAGHGQSGLGLRYWLHKKR
jgi:hypothetical protein